MNYTFDARRFASAFLGLVMLVVGSAPAVAQGQSSKQDIRAMLQERDQQIKSILKGTDDYTPQQREELKTLINGVIDFRAMGKTALGPFWSDLSDAQRTEFIDVFREVVRAQSLSDLEVYNSQITFGEITVEGDSAFVRTTTQYEGTATPVEYVLQRDGDTWRAEDIIVDGVSTAEGYARSFQNIMRKRNFEYLMDRLEKRRDQVQS